jgi:hypothetical protein
MIKVGDRVKFLNDVGGGVVIAIKDKRVAVVMQDDGFEMPVLLHECLKTETETSAPKPKPIIETKPAETYSYNEIASPKGEQISLLLAFVVSDTNSIDYSDLDLYLVNDSNYFCQFTVASTKAIGSNLIDRGEIEPNTKQFLGTFERRNLNDFKSIWLCGQFFKADKPFEKREQIDFNLILKPEKFLPNRFKRSGFFPAPAALFYAIENDEYKSIKKLIDKSISEGFTTKEAVKTTPKLQKQTRPEIIEVDLHINELLDTVSGLSNADILNYQMTRFRDVLEENKDFRGQKIVFIHGIGNGTLKTELRKELDRKKIRHQDASFREYGYGATMVIV